MDIVRQLLATAALGAVCTPFIVIWIAVVVRLGQIGAEVCRDWGVFYDGG